MSHSKYKDKKVIVLGYGRSGRSAVNTMIRFGANVVLTTNEIFADESIRQLLKGQGVEIVDGHHPVSLLNDAELIIKNPGIPYSIEFIQEAEQRGITIITEVELTKDITDAGIIGITGTNGKTTVTHLIGDMMDNDNKKPILCGNIGYPASEAAFEADSDSVLVMELSSFQMMGVNNFKPDVAVLTNIYEAHMDYHSSKEEYVNAKLSLLNNLTGSDTIVFNNRQKGFLDSYRGPAGIKYFTGEGYADAYIEDGYICFEDQKLINIDNVLLRGSHNYENILAAIIAVKQFGVSDEAIIRTLKTFGGIPHRMEYLGIIDGVKYYNDSKATNNLATSFALDSFEAPTVWIAGGLDRGQSFDELSKHAGRVKHLVAYGETAKRLSEFARMQNIGVSLAENPYHAVLEAKEIAEDGEIVLFSPACASWDQYKDYEARGDHYKEGFHKIY
ncbi:UDP-N-acetylmuramoyl-L-alanine--D-glutamate ligase [Salinicoccus sp. YB14-2]|uniref:UDP-N-acetylmuramoyl-L-alanine--D-glutamate ligase n=1 Tax=Salinicoccus sp. YB14-2 TaxID=1572701 RepID=UPI00068C6CFC|nr:UDP-N-acetylmuramoyl-L-alanine--D-glutamate ligase [Salinicoccus sp. YB14-2]